MVDINFDMEARSAMLFQIEIYECPLGSYCKPYGDTGLSAMYGYV
jgi:hypothetical protein